MQQQLAVQTKTSGQRNMNSSKSQGGNVMPIVSSTGEL